MKFLLVFFLLFSVASLAQIESEKTVITSIKSDKAEEVKPLLLHQATLSVIEQYSTELGINYDLFKEKLEQKSEEAFSEYRNRKLMEKFGKNFAAELTEEQRTEFLKGLESHRSNHTIETAKLASLLDTYAFKTIENTETGWKATIALNLNRTKLERFNARLFSNQPKVYSKLYLISEFDLFDLAWSDLGLEKSSSFSDPLMASWNKWLQANQPETVEEVVICTGPCLSTFGVWQQLPQDHNMKVSEDFLDALLVKVSFNLRKLYFSTDINEWKFEWDGSVVLLDANTKRAISSYTMNTETKTWRGLGQKDLNSALASSMYRSPLDSFNKLTKKVKEQPKLNRLSRLVIQGHYHLGDVLSLMDILRKSGSAMNFDVQLDIITKNEAQLLCFYQGEEKSFTDLLSQVKELKSSNSYRVVNEFTGIHHVLKLIAE